MLHSMTPREAAATWAGRLGLDRREHEETGPSVRLLEVRGSEDVPTIRGLFLPLVGLLIPLGVVVLIAEDVTWLGVVLIVAGILAARALKSDGEQGPAKRRVE